MLEELGNKAESKAGDADGGEQGVGGLSLLPLMSGG